MHIVIDLQGAQSESRFRGIGRYSLSLAKGIAENRGDHTVTIVLNGAFPESVVALRMAFDGLIPAENIRVFQGLRHVHGRDVNNRWRRQAAEQIREAFIASLSPDIVLISSLFEGFVDDAVTSVPVSSDYKTAVVLYDLIPLLNPTTYLAEPLVKAWYEQKIGHLRRADSLLAISASSAGEAIEHLGWAESRVTNISGAAGPEFAPGQVSAEDEARIRKAFHLNGPFVLCAPGGFDPRKNVPRLMEAWAALPAKLRADRQLVIASKAPWGIQRRLEKTRRKTGLKSSDVVFTGYVPDRDLVDLYRLAELFVFPSLHEGFGLPALEAMSCGVPTIGSDSSSIAEVIGRADAMFDPADTKALADRLSEVLSSPERRRDLAAYARERAALFSWDATATTGLKALEAAGEAPADASAPTKVEVRSQRLAVVVPSAALAGTPAHRMTALLAPLGWHYQVDLLGLDGRQASDLPPGIGTVLGLKAAEQALPGYDRILYCLGDGPGAELVARMAQTVPGALLLLDPTLTRRLEAAGGPEERAELVYRCEGYPALETLAHPERWTTLPLVQDVVGDALGVIAGNPAVRAMARETLQDEAEPAWPVVPDVDDPPLPRTSVDIDRAAARRTLGLGDDEEAVAICADPPSDVGLDALVRTHGTNAQTGARRHVLVLDSRPSKDRERLAQQLSEGAVPATRVTILDPTHKQSRSAVLSVTETIHFCGTRPEGDGSGLARLLRADGATLVPSKPEADQRVGASWADNDAAEVSSPVPAADAAWALASALGAIYAANEHGLRSAVRAIAQLRPDPSQAIADDNRAAAAEALAATFPTPYAPRQLLVDVSELSQRDARSGVQRVVRNILREWLANPPAGFRIEPVYASPDGYRYATRFTLGMLGLDDTDIEDRGVEATPGDVLLVLDLQHQVAEANRSYFRWLQARGVNVYFVVYDLLPILVDGAFPEQMAKVHADWLNIVTESDGAFCISRAVADELAEWATSTGRVTDRPFKIGWFHLGADFTAARSWVGLPPDAQRTMEAIKAKPTFLMVGTVEPRKGHAQVLEAFDLLWRAGSDVNLVIVGKEGWMVKPLVKRLKDHPERGKRLFWLEGISDEFLERIYSASTCLIAASKGEGFGLPLIEAAQHKIPILARDIPVFREVAGDHAAYFSGTTGEALADAVRNWLAAHGQGTHPRSDQMPWASWKDAADELGRKIVEKDFYLELSTTNPPEDGR